MAHALAFNIDRIIICSITSGAAAPVLMSGNPHTNNL
jgi:hypothetical protein